MNLRLSSLRQQLLFMSLAVVFFPVLLATVFSYLSQKEQIDRSLQRELNASLGACRLYYENLQERLEMMTLATANNNTCKTTLRLGVFPQLQKQVSQLASEYGMDFLLVTGLDGVVVALYPQMEEYHVDLSSHPLVQAALQGKATTAANRENHLPFTKTAAAIEQEKRSPLLFIESAMPITIRETQIGTVFSGIRLSGNATLMQEMQAKANADRVALVMEREVAAASFQSASRTESPLLELVYPIGKTGNTVFRDEPLTLSFVSKGKRLAVKWYPVNGAGGQPVAALVTLLDYERAAVLIKSAVVRILWVFAVGMVLAVVISFFVSQSIVVPVKALSTAVQNIRNGKMDQAIPIPVGRGDEIGILARGVSSMLSKLQSQFNELLQEVKERERADMSLADEKERLAVTLASIGDGVITTDIEGRIVFINKVAEQLTGWSNEEAQGKPSPEVFNIINEKTGQRCASPIHRVLERGRIVGLANHTALIAKDGTRRSIADSGAPIRDRKSKIIGVVLVFRDITLEKKMEEELVKARKLESVGVLAGGIAHDFNNILSAILGNIELTRYRVKDDAEALDLLSDAQRATRRATKLTQQLLTFSKGGDPVKETASLPNIITESADFVLHGSQVSCEYTFQDDLWHVSVDSGQIGQVIQNIILNAKHAMPQGGRISICCTNIDNAASDSLLNVHEGNFVRITVQDRGVGIPPDIIDNIFDPYFSTKQEGSGLGLAICYSIINKHDGYITAQSEPGRGTLFTIYLPAATTVDITAAEKSQLRPLVKSARIIVMDDEEMIRQLAQRQFSLLGHETIPVEDGEEALNKYQELQDSGTPVDLVIMDLTIPGGMGGQEAARQLLHLDPEAKIIVASGYSNDPVLSNYQEYGFVAAIAKPFDLNELRKVLDSTLS